MIKCSVLERKPVIMMGDFNCDMLQPNSYACKLAMVMFEYGLSQMVNGPTRVTEEASTKIDLLFTMDVELVQKVGCEEPGLSDLVSFTVSYHARLRSSSMLFGP